VGSEGNIEAVQWLGLKQVQRNYNLIFISRSGVLLTYFQI
jgi:hypothetical protein